MSDLMPIDGFVRSSESLGRDDLVVRGWPLTVGGLLRNANATRSRYSYGGVPLTAVSVDVTIEGWSVDAILAGPRLRTRSRYAAAPVRSLVDAGFGLLATFAVPHYSVVLHAYTEHEAQHLLDVLGAIRLNPYHRRRQP